MAQNDTEQSFLPNGLHAETLDYVFAVFADVRDEKSKKVAAEMVEGADLDNIIHDLWTVAGLTAALAVIERGREEPPATVGEYKSVAEAARARFAQESAERSAFFARLEAMAEPKDERDIN